MHVETARICTCVYIHACAKQWYYRNYLYITEEKYSRHI